MEPKKTFTLEEAEELARGLGVDFSFETFDVEEFRLALSIELEHGTCHSDTDVTHDDPVLTGKLALAHLHTRPDFYEHLLKVEGDVLEN